MKLAQLMILSTRVAVMPAKGLLAARSRKKYGRRRDDRAQAIREVLKEVPRRMPRALVVKSDQCPRYPTLIKEILPGLTHLPSKGRRSCVVGQGELKGGGFDPLFALNHSCAMIRDNVKRLSRRTWCTSKRPDRLQCLLELYRVAHNGRILEPRRRPVIMSGPVE